MKRFSAAALTLILALVFCAPPARAAESTLDTNVVYCLSQGILRTGAGDPFTLKGPLSKIQFIVMISRAYGLHDDGGAAFYLSKGEHFNAAAEKGLVTAEAFPQSAWASPISRFEAATICHEVLTRLGGYTSDGTLLYVGSASDRDAIPQEYREAVNTVYAAGVMQSTDDARTFNGWEALTGAEGCDTIRKLKTPELRTPPQIPSGYDQLMGTCTTYYGGAVSGYTYRDNRIFNILKAGGVLNELVVQPGEVFDFNKTIGNAGKAEGYLMAPILNAGEHDTGYGGGLCQISTMVFNAALNANMTILERYNHSLKSLYIAAGMDSTVYYPSLNLRWRNQYPCAVKLVFTHDKAKETVTISIYGSAEITVPKVELKVTVNSQDVYTLKRTADGVVNYTTNSKYKK